jgi:hypothetical protein
MARISVDYPPKYLELQVCTTMLGLRNMFLELFLAHGIHFKHAVEVLNFLEYCISKETKALLYNIL